MEGTANRISRVVCFYTTRSLRGHYFLVLQVAEEGTHEELLSSRGGVYAGLVKRQLDVGGTGGKEDLGRSTPRPSSVAIARKSLP